MGFLSSLHATYPAPNPVHFHHSAPSPLGECPPTCPPSSALTTSSILGSGREWRLSQWLAWRWCGPLSWMQPN